MTSIANVIDILENHASFEPWIDYESHTLGINITFGSTEMRRAFNDKFNPIMVERFLRMKIDAFLKTNHHDVCYSNIRWERLGLRMLSEYAEDAVFTIDSIEPIIDAPKKRSLFDRLFRRKER